MSDDQNWLAQPPPTDDLFDDDDQSQDDTPEGGEFPEGEFEDEPFEEEPILLTAEPDEVPLDPPTQFVDPPGSTPLISISKTNQFPDVVENVFPACQVHLIGGSQGSGKTAFEVWMYSHIMDELPFLGHATHRPPFWGCLVFDRTIDDRLSWWRQAGLDSAPPYYCLTNDPKINPITLDRMPFTKTFEFLTNKIEEWNPPPGSVITVDVANFFMGDVRLGYKSGFAHGWALSKYAHDKKITIFGVVHGGKQKSHDRYARLTDRIIASTGFLGAVGTVSYLTTQDETNRDGIQEYQWIPHNAPSETFELTRTPEGFYRPYIRGHSTKHKQAGVDMVQLTDYIFPTVDNVSYAFIAKTMEEGWDMSTSTARRCIKKMEEKGLIKKVRHGWYRKCVQS